MVVDETKLAEQLRAAVDDLARNEEKLAELLAGTQPTTDLATEEKRVRELQVKEMALRRVIAANQKAIDDVTAAIEAARKPRLEAELAAARAEALSMLDDLVERLWAVYEATDGVDELHGRIATLRQQVGGNVAYASPIGTIRAIQAVRSTTADALEKELQVATMTAGPRQAPRLKRRDLAAERARREADAKRVAGKKNRKQLERMQTVLRQLKEQV